MRGGNGDTWLDRLSTEESAGALRRIRQIVNQSDGAASTPRWQRSTYPTVSNAVEVLKVGGAWGLRDSSDPDGERLVFAESSWQAFIAAVKEGQFD